jgi:hypothetical protein
MLYNKILNYILYVVANMSPPRFRLVLNMLSFSADERGRKQVQITGNRRSPRESGARICCLCFCFSLWYLLSTVQINLFRPSQCHSANIVCKVYSDFSQFAMAELPVIFFFFHTDSNPLSADLFSLVIFHSPRTPRR